MNLADWHEILLGGGVNPQPARRFTANLDCKYSLHD